MPTVLRFDGLRVVIYFNDHEPMHVHVVGGGGRAIFNLNADGTVELREQDGFKRGDIKRIRAKLVENHGQLCEEWSKVHGEP